MATELVLGGLDRGSADFDSGLLIRIEDPFKIAQRIAETLGVFLDDTTLALMRSAGLRDVTAFIEYQKGRDLHDKAHGNDEMLRLLAEGNVLTLFRFSEFISPTPVDKRIFQLVMQDEARHVSYGMQHLRWIIDNCPERKEAFGETVIDTLEEYIPNIRDIILHKQVLTPWDLEQDIGLTEGNIFHGELSLEQLLFLRPAAGWLQIYCGESKRCYPKHS